jgi:hypothetical protein|tara:strand:- start:816 stop:1022 length:207 start_codon:yes stop_codon:yes gene_type:complete
MSQNKKQYLSKFWNHNLNPITGWIDEKRKDERERSKDKFVDLNKYLLNQKELREKLLTAKKSKDESNI